MHSVCEKNLLASHFLLSNCSLVRAWSIRIQCFGYRVYEAVVVQRPKQKENSLFDIRC